MPRAPIRWLLVEWKDGSFGVINVKAVIGDVKSTDLTTGKLVTVNIGDMKAPAKIVMSSDDRKFLETQIHPMTVHKAAQVAAAQEHCPQIYEDIESKVQQPMLYEDCEIHAQSPRDGDFSASASSWSANDWSESEDDEEVLLKQIKREKIKQRYSGNSRRKPQRPQLKVQPVVPNTWRINESNVSNSSIVQRANEVTVRTFTTQTNIIDGPKTNPRKVMMYDQQVQTDAPFPSVLEVKSLYEEVQTCQKIIEKTKEVLLKLAPLFNIVNVLNELNGGAEQTSSDNKSRSATPAAPSPSIREIVKLRESTNERQEQLDNMPSSAMILNCSKTKSSTPKPKTLNGTVDSKKRKIYEPKKSENGADTGTEEMVRIGSGNTLVPKVIYDDINWSSFTMATRKLLSAVFPRSVLGTHSLTGKSSPAFKTRPAKRCLDSRKVADIIMTVTKKCQVKENLVRSAITIKCADEYKMMKCQNMKEELAKKRPRMSSQNS